MVLCIRQVQFFKISAGVLRTNGVPSSGTSWCTSEFYGRSFFYAASRLESVWEDSPGSDHGGNCQQKHKDDRDCENIQLEDWRCK